MPKHKITTVLQGEMVINTDEPIYILDPRNAYAPAALRGLINVLNNAGGNQGQLAAIDVQTALEQVEAWQAGHHTEVKPPEPNEGNFGSTSLDPNDFIQDSTDLMGR